MLSRHRCECNIEMHPKETGCKVLIELICLRIGTMGRVLVNTVMKS
jgi:hypothetical protein